ncbi:FkbM family methyltransferase [Aurantiacibacter marinus]|uniref:Methyltransferase FkbM domain-containing protein n=1 Tax=Aurantiacibacter marinus TaxID=874156 RepID=A0A0H0XUE9_9SPHN|nr:FkbM family methyltransferase [Aurantiacibacter marinus]KLI63900.1 hypothetical protein AAV99_09405 [Aurantiacibacter marinus]
MRNNIGHLVASASRTAPFERGRWRLGSLAYKLVDPGAADYHQIVTTRHGFTMGLDLRQFIDRTIYCTGEWEPHETQVIQRILRPGATFADVGANIGYFTLLASHIVGPAGHVHAFEANAQTHALLSENMARNSATNVSAHLLAVSDEAGSAVIHHCEPGNAGRDMAMAAKPEDRGSTVRMERLDTVLANTSITLIKLDIEGGEAKALRGAEALLTGCSAPDLLFELTPQLLTENGDDATDLLEWLRGIGYILSEISVHGGKASADALEQSYYHASKNG